jgi:hypothetical protein
MTKRNILSKIITAVLSLFLTTSVSAQLSTINYISSSAVIANPERGWYDDYYSHTGGSALSTNYRPLSKKELILNRERDKITLILRLFYLHEFLEQPAVSEEYIGKIQADFDSIRAAGVKCIIRFAYSASDKAAIWDATPDKVFSHIESLRNVLSANGDIIAGVQAGFVGAWGEWYYTRNFARAGFSTNATDKENRKILVEKLLDILPEHVSVGARTPAIMRYVTLSDTPIAETEAFTGTNKSRIGHHNDCFLANSSNYGTYLNLETDLAYLHETTKYTITGGETCDASNIYSDCVNSVPKVKELHWTYLNRDYNKNVYNKWTEQGCYKEINISLGYRIRLVSAIIPDSVDQGTSLNLSIKFSNDGYAAPTQYKPVQIVLTHTLTGNQTILDYTGTRDDVRFWLPGEIQLDGSVAIPVSMSDGNYRLGIKFPDQFPKLTGNPAYSIQMANAGTWDEVNGINDLNHIISAGSGGDGVLPITPVDLNAVTISESQIDLVWSHGLGDENGFEIMRSVEQENIWTQVGIFESSITSLSDTILKRGTVYNYIIRGINNYGNSAWSGKVNAATLGVGIGQTRVKSVTLYPNPLNNSDLFLFFPDESEKQIIIRNISGGMIFETTTDQAKFYVNKDLFKSGIYLVSSYQDNGILNRKLIVL